MSNREIDDIQEDKADKGVSGLKNDKEKIKKTVKLSSKEETSDLEDNKKVKFDIEGKIMLVRVGNDDRPANPGDIEEIEDKLIKLLDDNNINCAVLVTHHAVSIDLIEPSSK